MKPKLAAPFNHFEDEGLPISWQFRTTWSKKKGRLFLNVSPAHRPRYTYFSFMVPLFLSIYWRLVCMTSIRLIQDCFYGGLPLSICPEQVEFKLVITIWNTIKTVQRDIPGYFKYFFFDEIILCLTKASVVYSSCTRHDHFSWCDHVDFDSMGGILN